ncbi:MAG: glycoside hydrolase family 65 protein [Sporolactobacillus sp.]
MERIRLFDVDTWKLTTETLHRADMRVQESLTALGNGYMGMRGNFEETYSGDHHQGTYLAGVWYPDKTRVGWWKNGYPDYFGKVINAFNWIGMRLFIDGEEVDLYTDRLDAFSMELDMYQGILRHAYVIEKNHKKVRVSVERFLSIVNREICAIRFCVTALTDRVNVQLISTIDGDVRNQDASNEEMFWEPYGYMYQDGRLQMSLRTKANAFAVPRFTISAAMAVVSDFPTQVQARQRPLYAEETRSGRLDKGQTGIVDKLIAVTTSRDYASKQMVTNKSFELLNQACDSGYSELKNEHVAAWARRWEKADVCIEGDAEAQQGIRFNLFQLFSTYYGDDARLNIGPKGFTGEKYGGATYWDTEAYVVPFYLAVAPPNVTKQLLLYRYQQLKGAYANAARLGVKGALYPMVTFDGTECHNEWEITFEEIHRNGAIAYAIYNYVTYTGDQDYIEKYGSDVLVGISRFWADRVHYSERRQRYVIHGVTGPNEYENNVNNNWYTNTMAAWTLEYTVQIIDQLSDRKYEQLALSQKELAQWQAIVQSMYYPVDEQLGIFVQNDDFLDKAIQPAASIPEEERPLNQHWSWDKILRSCYIKQADVLQGIYFLSHRFTLEEKRRNFDFYEPLTVHESSLSPSVHAILAAELKEEDKALALYQRTARLDLDNYNQDTDDGLHITSMTGSWLAIVQGFAGMRTFRQLSFAPFLPRGWKRYAFKLNYRGRLLRVTVDSEKVQILLISGLPLKMLVYRQQVLVSDQQPIEIRLNGADR